MKAILEINGFTKVIDIIKPMAELYVPCIEPLNIHSWINDGLCGKDTDIKKWRFVYFRDLYQDIALYKYDGEYNDKKFDNPI